jgi:lipopolysaccharide transport system ATP-binding protein
MGRYIVKVEGLSKRYQIGSKQGYKTYGSLRDSLIEAAIAPIRRLRRSSKGENLGKPNEIWALENVSFEVPRGATVGIIGRNGAGKSTLLKILSRITKPTKGLAILRGRVGSLLEVGTGFHPELSGRENIYLNGAILGMTRAEIDKKFDEIVEFAEIEKFLDTPVKFYSSGMYMRLAFSVAAHLESEILLVDEVLAVGDAQFQRKSLGKMKDVASYGRTVFFVSHNMGAIATLCDTSMLLDQGNLITQGEVSQVIDQYINTTGQSLGEADLSHRLQRSKLMIESVILRDEKKQITSQIPLKDGLRIEIHYRVYQTIRNAQLSFELWTGRGVCVLSSSDWDEKGPPEQEIHSGFYAYSCYVPPVYLRPGRYWLELSSSIPNIEILDQVPNSISFDILDTGSLDARLGHGRNGVISPILSWEKLDQKISSR